MKSTKSLIPVTRKNRLLTEVEFRQLAAVPAEVEWFRNLDSPHTERAYRNAIGRLHALYRHSATGFAGDHSCACDRMA